MEPERNVKKKSMEEMVLMVIPLDGSAKPKQFSVRRWYLWAVCGVILAGALVSGIALHGRKTALKEAWAGQNELQAQMEELTGECQKLQQDKALLQDKVALLSAAVNESKQTEAANAVKSDPTGYPLSGTATMEEKTDEDGNPMMEFKAAGAEMVLAAANGTVAEITADRNYGTKIRMDHGNGYETIYYTDGSVKVKEGDEITGGTMLAEMDEEHTTLGYQILQNGVYVSPAQKLEIYG